MPDDAVRGQNAFRADLLVSQTAQSRGNAGRFIKCEQPAAALGLIAAQRIHQPVQCLLVGECAAERLHGFLTAQERRQQVEVVRTQLAVVHAAGVQFVKLHRFNFLPTKRCGFYSNPNKYCNKCAHTARA